MLRDPEINLTDLFTKGFTVTSLDLSRADDALANLKLQTFKHPDRQTTKEHPNYHMDSGLFYCDCVTEFSKPKGYGANTPRMGMGFREDSIPYFNSFWDQVAAQPYFNYFRNNFGPFSQLSKQMNFYSEPGEGLSWHNDYQDASFMINIITLTDDNFEEADGAFLEFGKATLGESNQFIPESIKPVGKVIPKHGTLVTINNMVPGFLHTVAALTQPKSRYSLICQFGFSSNVMHSLKQKGWNVIS